MSGIPFINHRFPLKMPRLFTGSLQNGWLTTGPLTPILQEIAGLPWKPLPILLELYSSFVSLKAC